MDFVILPTLVNEPSGCINLDACAHHYWADLGIPIPTPNPCLDPWQFSKMLDGWHYERRIKWSWGDWMRPRPTLWDQSYLAATGKWLHLGHDFNVPVNTPVAAHGECTVVRVDDDYPEKHGWGHRVVVRDHRTGLYVIYAHLGLLESWVVSGIQLRRGQFFAVVGGSLQNGGWYPHLHLQTVVETEWWRFELEGLTGLDGYGHPEDRDTLMARHPDPIVALKI